MAVVDSALGGGALLGVILSAFGLKKVIRSEVANMVAPIGAKVSSIQNEVAELKGLGLMTEQGHQMICQMNQKYIDERIASIQTSLDLQVTSVKEHIDSKFDELTRRLDRRRSTDTP